VSAGPTIGIIDYGMGNRRSVEKALEHVGVRACLTDDHDALRAADGLILPGVGAFARGMERLRALGLDELVRERVAAGVPVLGLCLGMQLAFESSTELGGAEGLGIIPGEVRRLEAGELKLPHIGWNLVTFTRPSSLRAGLPDRCAFYHVHSYVAHPRDEADVLARAEYGSPFVTMVARGSFCGAQFHPEKSSTHGLRLLANFAGLGARGDETTPPAPMAARAR
jgi:imidazole glycerol-phosphate synthase subunit HisH